MEYSSVKHDGRYKGGDGKPYPYETLILDELFVINLIPPIENFFRTLYKSHEENQREIGEIGLSLLRDVATHWEKIVDKIKKDIGEIELDVYAMVGEEKDLLENYEYPDYLGVRLEANKGNGQ